MIRSFGVAAVLSCVTTLVLAQAQHVPGTATTSIRPAVNKPAPKAKPVVKLTASPDTGPCQIGVIPAIGNNFVVQNVGITVFGNEYTEVPTDWGFDELAVARVRSAAGPGASIRRIAYAAGDFDPYYHPARRLFYDPRDDLTAVVRKIAANSSCTKYIVITQFKGRLEGTNQSLDGVGVFTRTKLFKKGVVFANVHVTVFDGRSFAIRKDPFASFGAILSASFAKLGKDENLRPLDSFEIPEPPQEISHDARIRDAARDLIAEQLDKRLPEYLKDAADQP